MQNDTKNHLKKMGFDSITFDGAGYPSFSKLINECIEFCPTDYVIICNDKSRPEKVHFDKMLSLLEQGYGFVGLYTFGFFGFHKSLVKKIGFFDERFINGEYEDCDYMRRIAFNNIAMYLSYEIPYLEIGSSWKRSGAREHYFKKWKEANPPDDLVCIKKLREEKYNYNLKIDKEINNFLPYDKSVVVHAKWMEKVIVLEDYKGESNMEIDLISITTSQPQKQVMFIKNSYQNISKVKIKNKFVGIDMIEGQNVFEGTENFLKDFNYIVDKHPLNGMINNLSTVIDLLESEWVLYTEDDVRINELPDLDRLLNFINSEANTNVGIIDLMAARGIKFTPDAQAKFKENALDPSSYYSFDDYTVWLRTNESIDNFFINFPVLFIKREIFQSCFNTAKELFKGTTIEVGFTKAFVHLNLHEKYSKVHIFKQMPDLNFIKDMTSTDISLEYFNNLLLMDNKDTAPGLDFSVSHTHPCSYAF